MDTIFDYLYPKFKIDKPVRLIELFAGYGSQALALKYLGVEFEHWKTCEWAVKSIQAYKDIHFTDENADYSKELTKEQLGYKNYWKDLIATDYGIPQTRNRTFMISILGNYNYNFPNKIPLKIKLKDMLENNVDEKYYLSDKQIKDVQNWNAYEKPLENMEKIDKSNISPTLTTRSGAYAAGMVFSKRYRKL